MKLPEIFCQGCGKKITNTEIIDFRGFKVCSQACADKLVSLPILANISFKEESNLNEKLLRYIIRQGFEKRGFTLEKISILNIAHYQFKQSILFSLEIIKGAGYEGLVKESDFGRELKEYSTRNKPRANIKKVTRTKVIEIKKETSLFNLLIDVYKKLREFYPTNKEESRAKKLFKKYLRRLREIDKLKSVGVDVSKSSVYYTGGIFKLKENDQYPGGETRKKVREILSKYDGQPRDNIPVSVIANQVGVSKQRVSQIIQILQA